jgi:hypothetical protein
MLGIAGLRFSLSVLFGATLQIEIHRVSLQLSRFTLFDLEGYQKENCVNLIAHPKQTLGHDDS